MKVFEKSWFKWVLIGGSCCVTISVLGAFATRVYLDKRERDAQIEAQLESDREYEDRFRSAMTRIYQNLNFKHFLAAYKNLETLPEPRHDDPLKVDQYIEVLNRVGNGLIQNQLLKEAEGVFLTIRNFEGQVTKANEALGKIESKRRIENAKFFVAQGDPLLQQKRYREANREYEKAQLELRSVEILQYDNVKELWTDLKPKLLKARFYTLLDDADHILKDADKFLSEKKFKQTDQSISAAAIKVGRAAYLDSQSPEVAQVRRRINDLDAELGYQLPNAVPIWNRFTEIDAESLPRFFNLVSYEMSPAINPNGQVKIGLQYKLNPENHFFVIRYRIFFYNGRDIFNGHFLTPAAASTIDQVQSIAFLQEIPQELRSSPIKRIEIKVFNADDEILARVTRAFRKTGA